MIHRQEDLHGVLRDIRLVIERAYTMLLTLEHHYGAPEEATVEDTCARSAPPPG